MSLIDCWVYGQISVDQIRLFGTIVDSGNGDPLPGVHLIGNEKNGAITDIDGNFSMELSGGDTVLITHVGYSDYLVPIPIDSKNEYRITIGLTASVTELHEVTIYQWPATLALLKQRILAMEVEDEDQLIIPGSYHGPPKPVNPGIGSPISFLQSKLSKKIRRRREFLKKRSEIESSKRARSRYHTEFVKEVTGIKDDHELEEFIEYCELTDSFLGDVNDYELIVAINRCYKNFKSKRSD